MYKLLYIFVVFIFFNNSWTSFDQADIEKKMPFKLGYEFQVVNGACHWAKGNPFYQKKEIFSALHNGQKLWHVEIDNVDIEFVLVPFSHEENNLLSIALQSVIEASKIITLRDLFLDFSLSDFREALKANKSYSSNFFVLQKLIGTLKEKFKNESTDILDEFYHIFEEFILKTKGYELSKKKSFYSIWESCNEDCPTLLKGLLKSSVEISFSNWIKCISDLEDSNIKIEESNFYKSNKAIFDNENNVITLDKILTIQPQATIQFPLEYTIPLIFSIFGQDILFIKNNIIGDQDSIINDFLKCLPYLETLKKKDSVDLEKKQFEDLIYSKRAGLIFLHAYTLTKMFYKKSLSGLIGDLVEADSHGQVDAKRNIALMSRFSFSEMWRNIPKEVVDGKEIKYEEKFQEILVNTNEKYSDFHLNIKASSLNYGEEFYSYEENICKDLTFLWDVFFENFRKSLKCIDENSIKKLLKKGIISTWMIENLDLKIENIRFYNDGLDLEESNQNLLNFFRDFYMNALATVQKPKYQWNITFDNEGLEHGILIEQVKSNHDILSPPFPLSADNSMGRFKDSSEQQVNEFGEAIIEIRMIKKAFPKKFKINPFLTQFVNDDDKFKGESFINQGIFLHEFLCSFKF